MAGKEVSIASKALRDVKLAELGAWIGSRDMSPKGIVAAMCRGRDRYLNKYIYVKKGGIGGIAMIVAGYVMLSYVWEYDHIKHDRWRKYH